MIEVWKLIKSLRRRMSAFGVKRTLTRDTIGITPLEPIPTNKS